jgi:hypothetical protein
LDPPRADAPFEGFSVEKLYALVSGCRLTSPPGATHAHGGIGNSLVGAVLNQAVALRAGRDYEPLLTARLFRPLDMNDTRLSLTPELESRFAPEHGPLGFAITRWRDVGFTLGVGGYSTANDPLKMAAACGANSSPLRPLWDNTAANFSFAPQRAGMLHTGGGWFANGCYIGFDKARRRGVVVLASAHEPRHEMGILLVESEWPSDRRPQPARISRELSVSYAGQYRRSPIYALGSFVVRQNLLDAPWTVTLLPAGLFLAGLAVLLWRARNSRRRRFILGGVVLVGMGSAALLPITGLTLHYRGQAFIYDNISDVPPKAPEPVKPPVIVSVDTNRLDACVGRYAVAPGAVFPQGLRLAVWRQGAQLFGRAEHPADDRVLLGAFPLFPESETNFLEKITGAEFRFTKNEQGQVIALAQRSTRATTAWFPDWEATKLK